mgnify:CR=1 FL=1
MIDFKAIRATNPIADVVNCYLPLTRRGSEFVARCPFHNDSSPSFCVVPKHDRAFCMSCGWHGDVVDFIAEFDGIDTAEAARRLTGDELPSERPRLPDLPPDEASDWTPIIPAPAHATAYDPEATYNPRRGRVVNWRRNMTRCDVYRAADGTVIGYVVRLEIEGKKLTPTVTWARHADGRECWASVKFPNPRPLQGLDDLAARPDASVLVVSGEKCREVGARWLPGFVTVTWPGGDNNVLRADWTPMHGRRVTLWPDADQSGIEACQRLAQALHGHASEVRVIDPSGEPEGWDIADGVAAGMDTAALRNWAAARVSVWTPHEPPKKTAPVGESGADLGGTREGGDRDGSDGSATDAGDATLDIWPDPINLLGTFEPPVVRAEWLPQPVVDFVFEQADLVGADPSTMALSVIVACASAIHDGIGLQPKRHDPTWIEHARLWGAIVGDPSTRKTPVIKAAVSRLRHIDRQKAETSAGKLADYERELKVYKKREAAWINADARGDAAGSLPEPPEPPTCERLIVEDITIEAMSNVLKDNDRGVLVITDELSGWFGSMDAYKGSGGKDRGLWLEIYNGGPKRVDRVMRGSILVPNWSASMLGGIQPEAIRRISTQLYDDGLMQRFMVVCGRPVPGGSQDRPPNMDAINAYRTLLDELYSIQPGERAVTLSNGAHDWRERMTAFSHGLTQAEMLTTSFRSHLGKWDGLFARLLLAYHCIECRSARVHPDMHPVSEDTAKRVHDFMRYFLFPHASSFYMGVLARSERDSAADWIAEWILADRRGMVSLREIMQSYKRWRAMPDWQQRLVMRSLEDAGWIMADGETIERRVNRWVVNPKVHALFGAQAAIAAERKQRSRDLVREAFSAPE